jgi:hypothetical protein
MYPVWVCSVSRKRPKYPTQVAKVRLCILLEFAALAASDLSIPDLGRIVWCSLTLSPSACIATVPLPRHYANPSRLAIDHPETHAIPLLRHYASPAHDLNTHPFLDR